MEAETNVVSSEDQTEDPGNFAVLANVSTDSTTSPACGASHLSGGASPFSGGARHSTGVSPFSSGASRSSSGAIPFSGRASHSTGGASCSSGGAIPVGGSSEDGGIAMDMGIKKIPGKSHSIAKKNKVTNTGSIRL